jgi:anaerobic C4-dicarboxylate transporter DcuA
VSILLVLQFAVVLAAIYFGSRAGGVGLGLWGAVGVLVLTVIFGLPPTSPPIDVMLIILAVIMASAVMETAGGIKFLVRVAERIIRRYPKQITVVAPLVSYLFTFGAGTGHVFYPLLPVIYEVAHENKIRPERPIAISTIASQQAITASPVSAAMAAMIALFATSGIGLIQIMLIAVPATLTGVIVAALVQMRIGKELEKDPEYLRRLEAGEIQPPKGFSIEKEQTELPAKARLSALLFLGGVVLVVLAGAFPQFRPQVPGADGLVPLGMPLTIQIVMLSVGALILLVTKAPVAEVPRSSVAQAGLTAVIGIFGLAWLGDTFIKANEQVVISNLGAMAQTYPATFAIGLFFASVLLFSQAATTRALMPLGISLGIPAASLIGMWPAVNGYFFLPTYGSLIAAMNFDRSGTTRIGRFILNHSFMIPGLISTITAVAVGLLIGNLFF